MVKRGDQKQYSDFVPLVLNEENRKEKAEKILKILQDFVGKGALDHLRCLDIGCSGGIIDLILSEHVKSMVGLDIDKKAIHHAGSMPGAERVSFTVGSTLALPFESNCFDLLICNHVYAHVSDPQIMMQEIYRVLKPGGACYFAAGNKYTIIEGNYRLPFLSWLPSGAANAYLNTFRGIPEYYERHMSVKQLKRLVDDFHIIDYTIKVLQDAEAYGYKHKLGNSILKIFGKTAAVVYRMIPTYIWLLVKREGGK
jgi:2-polyprenyl-3-methyl-5-hydroxy-6-metoxy-1,4-benzoquinol methylase